eukprot:s1142_g12.t1
MSWLAERLVSNGSAVPEALDSRQMGPKPVPEILAGLYRSSLEAPEAFQAEYEASTNRVLSILQSFQFQEIDLQLDDRNALHYAAGCGCLELCEALLRQHPQLNFQEDRHGHTPLLWAVRHGMAGTMQLLLRHGAVPWHSDHRGLTAVHWACALGFGRLCKLLLMVPLNAEAMKDQRCQRGWTPLHSAAYSGCAACCDHLLSAGADDTLKTPRSEWTALHLAALQGQAGGLMLGFPLTDAVHRVATRGNPRFKVVRFTINKIRGAADPENFQLDSVVLLNRCGAPIHRSLVDQRHEANYWFVEIREGPELVTGYQLITHRTEGAECDPVSWVVEGSVDGVNWQLVDQCNDEPMPRQRESASQQYEDLLHLPDAQAAFRQGFLAEAAACAASFAWLVLGTSWVSAGTEACVDSAPHLWYWSYFLVVVMWSSLGTVTIGLIVCAVAMIMVGSKSP